MWNMSKKTGEYHDNVNNDTSTKWPKDKLDCNLPPSALVVVAVTEHSGSQM